MKKVFCVDIETAKLLKELGYDEPCIRRYVEKIPGTEREEWDDEECMWCTVSDVVTYPNPGIFEVHLWLIKRGLYVYPFWYCRMPEEKSSFMYSVNEMKPGGKNFSDHLNYDDFLSALRAGIKDALEHLKSEKQNGLGIG